jgi:cyclophilin family peptidyl-prolyl cis-trans isomerase
MLVNPSHRPPRPRPWIGLVISISLFAFLIVCVKPPSDDEVGSSNSERVSSSITPKNDALIDGDVHVQCELITPFVDDQSNPQAARGTIEITVHTGLAPLVSNAFLELVSLKHFDHNYIFRAVDGFIVQWGIESPTAMRNNSKEGKKFPKVNIDPPPSNADDTSNENILRSNVRGALNFAGGNSATGQVYVNRGTNLHLDNEPGSLPFATLDERSMKIIDSIYSYKEGLGQVKALKFGDDEVKRLFPRMSRIEKCWIQR